MQPGEAHSESQHGVCPGLSSQAVWDDPACLRGEIYSAEHMVEHAAALARAHGKPSVRITPGPLRKRFAAARARIREAYEVLSREFDGKREPTPAEEWLLDNSHVVDDQIREIQEDLPWGYLVELPRISEGAMRGYPRVYGLCLDYLRHTDARIDLNGLSSYVLAYQTVSPLTIGELWAVPIMLRLGLTLVVGALAASEAGARDRELADKWADRLIAQGATPEGQRAVIEKLDAAFDELGDGFLVQLLKRMREHDAPLGVAAEWVRARAEAMNTTPDELARRAHLRQAADQVSVGNAITGMRAIAALDWTRFFELTSSVEAILREDPAGAYGVMDDASRDECRHAIEKLSRRSRYDEQGVARAALELAQEKVSVAGSRQAERHVGFYLLDEGRRALERKIRYRPRLVELLSRPLRARPMAAYLGAIVALTALSCLGAAWLSSGVFESALAVSALTLLFVLPASELVLSAVNAAVVSMVRPRLLPKLAFEQGIPEEHRTLVVVPSLLDGQSTLSRLLEDLEVRSLANPDKNLHFALLTDFSDADEAETPEDEELLGAALDGIAELNRRFGDPDRYHLLHRRRLHNPAEGRYMGWERKRGKLEELNRLLRGAEDTSFSVVTARAELLASVRYVITLDADTDLPREVARRLVGALAHPRNRPLLDPARQRVVRGYGIIQPRVGVLPLSSRRSRFARIFAGPPGVDPYTSAVSDVYQDLFGEGSFVGKGIYDVDAFTAALHGRVPENSLLSHDLFEGSFARSALATDIEVFDEQPASYEVVASRQHRWLRGDWQLLPWLLPLVPGGDGRARKNDLRLLDWFKIADNLRRSLVAPALIALFVVSWSFAPSLAPWALGAAAAVFLGPLVVRQALALARASTQERSPLGRLGGDLVKNGAQLGLGVMLLLDQALLSADAVIRTLYRLCVSRRRLLEWTTMSQVASRIENGGFGLSRRFASSAVLALAVLAALVWLSPATLPYAAPLLLAWSLAPPFVSWLGRPLAPPAPAERMRADDRALLRQCARKTWRFFETFVSAEDNWLPPDNYQEDPRGVIAHRTSPTNIGLYLLSVVAARDLGFVCARDALDRLERTLATLFKMERRAGHVLNWYDTTTLRPLEPQYVSTVDSGNLAADLWALREACRELGRTAIAGKEAFEGARDAVLLSLKAFESEGARELERRIEHFAAAPAVDLPSVLAALDELQAMAERGLSRLSSSAPEEARYWLERAGAGLASAAREVRELSPCIEWLPRAPAALHEGALGAAWRELSARISAATSPAELAGAAAESLPQLDALEELLAQNSELSDAERASLSAYLLELRARLAQTAEACTAFVERADRVGAEAVELADGMDFRFLYDESRSLFSIGYNVSSARLDGSHYDLLASEARLASFVAISKGDAPLEHWSMLGRPRAATPSGRVLLSWSGSMFEYLMPVLLTGSNPDTLLWETCLSAVGNQRAYAAERGVPWGVSEAAYNVMDLSLTYQYRAFGVPGLGFKSGLAEDLVIAPYATALAAMVRPDEAIENFRALAAEGLDGKYGYYESVDYTPGHVPPGRRSVTVKAFMAHHQGMTLVALCNVLCGFPMQRRFFADARVKASALLLEERVPEGAPFVPVRTAQVAAPLLGEPELNLTDHVGYSSPSVPRVHLLGHGQLSTLVTAAGGGATIWKGLDVTRFREDMALESGGTYVYVRNLTKKKLWSAGFQPTRVVPDFYDASFSIDRAEFRRRDGAVETIMEVAVSPEHPAEVRRLTLTNHGEEPCEVDLTTYTEPVLAPHAADVAHRAFGSLFIETEALPERGAILARRRTRTPSEPESWLLQLLAPEGDDFGPAETECSRLEFVGRGGSLERPQALAFGRALSGQAGTVLDPGLAIRRRATLEPGRHARIALVTALAPSREAALELLDLYSAPFSHVRAFELAWADARVELNHLGISAAQAHRFQRLLSFLIYAPRSLRDGSAPSVPLLRGRSALWSHGISGDLPLLVACVDHPEFGELCRELLLAQEFWRLNGLEADLVFLNEEPSGYLQPLQEALLDLIRSSPADGRQNQRGGVFALRAGQMSEEERALLLRRARVVLRSSQGSLSQQLRQASAARPSTAAPLPQRAAVPSRGGAVEPRERLEFWNGTGGFGADGREYVMYLGPRATTPMPWCNVIANPRFGSVVSESGSGFSWCGNSQRERLTPWSNDAVCDPSGEVVYLRDDEDGSLWSATPAPASRDVPFVVRHGQGYSVFEHDERELHHELTVFVSATDPVKVLRLRVRNDGARPRRLSVFGVVEWALEQSRELGRLSVETEWDAERRAIFAKNPFAGAPESVAFFASSADVASFTADRAELFGAAGSRARPVGLAAKELSGSAGVGLDPCAALQIALPLAPGETREIAFVLGRGESSDAARELARAHADLGRASDELAAVRRLWDEILSIDVKTPDRAFDLMVGRWLLYQVTSARLWARSGFYQSSGAYGFRDQLQDVLALIHSRPELAREQLLRAAARQFEEGDVQHWWHPETGEGVRTRCSDDLLWLPYATAEYVRATGDEDVLAEELPFLVERALAPEDEDLFSAPRASAETATLYEHCVRALTKGLQTGPHGLPKIGSGDWNDGMNRIGHQGRGESVWLGWFAIRTLADFAEISALRRDSARRAWCELAVKKLAAAIEAHAWDGGWYRRAFYDDGTPVGSNHGGECRIDAIAQSWSVLSGVADPARARQALLASESVLVIERERMMMLLAPPFSDPARDPGYIRAYPPGIRENGGQYTHGVLWTVLALCKLGEGDRAARLLGFLNPIHHATDAREVNRYKVEPYVVAADVYSSLPHMGRGGWTWYTGSAAWMYRIAIESVLGLVRRGDRLEIAPCIPRAWPGFEVQYRHGTSELHIVVENPDGVSNGVQLVEVDGRMQADGTIPLRDDGRRVHVRVVMGQLGERETPEPRNVSVSSLSDFLCNLTRSV